MDWLRGIWRRVAGRRAAPLILVVEDDLFYKPLVRKAIQGIRPNAQIEWVSSTEEAIRAVRVLRPSLLIVDWMLGPGQGGIEVWRHCLEVCPHIPFLLMTGVDLESLQAFFGKSALRMPEVIRKPFFIDHLQVKIDTMLRQSVQRKKKGVRAEARKVPAKA